MKTSGVRELKTHLSAFLREVARGEVVLVTDRGQVVAELRPPGDAARSALPLDLRRLRLIERDLLRPASSRGCPDLTAWPLIRLEPGTAQALLDAERGE